MNWYLKLALIAVSYYSNSQQRLKINALNTNSNVCYEVVQLSNVKGDDSKDVTTPIEWKYIPNKQYKPI